MPVLPARAARHPAARPPAVVRRLLVLLAVVVGLLAVAVAGPASASSAPAPPGPGLTDRQAAVVLDLVDDVCGDTWCEGDVAFDFRSFSCAPELRTCVLRLRLAPYDDGPRHWYWRTGTTHGFTRYDQMVQTSSSGALSLREDFYLAVDDLIGRVEQRTPRAALSWPGSSSSCGSPAPAAPACGPR